MINKTDIHPVQAEILCYLLFTNQATFSELNKNKLGSDLFSFHLRQLNDWKLVAKSETGKYSLTTKGKEYANRFDTEAKEVERQAKTGVLIIGMKNIDGQKYYLLQQRLKQPYYGFWGSITGKLKWGETVTEGAKRELKEETGLTGEIKLVGVKHKMDYDKDGLILEDKFFYVCRVIKIKDNLQEEFAGGKNRWLTKAEIKKLDNLFDGVFESIEMAESNNLIFKENKYQVKGY